MTIDPPAPPYVGPAAHTSEGDNKPIKRIVIHSTVSPCVPGGARQIAEWFRDPRSAGSAHYVVDPSETVQVVFDGVIAWHAPPNAGSLGVELCDMPSTEVTRWSEENHRRMLRRAAKLVAELCLAYDIPPRKVGPIGLKAGRGGICGHVDVSQAFGQSSHWDPGAFPWRRFMRHVHRAYDERKSS
jgi:N-acetyl-anhydromuramyl-L-alanine amidase AmpD